ncbi:MAG TPA: hypothetical protein VGD81_19580, partial [Opitutaceae bacterium]
MKNQSSAAERKRFFHSISLILKFTANTSVSFVGGGGRRPIVRKASMTARSKSELPEDVRIVAS